MSLPSANPRLALGGHWKKKNGLLTRSSFASRLVLARPLQGHVHVGVLPGAVGVVVVALQALIEVTFVGSLFLRRHRPRMNTSSQVHTQRASGK